MGIGYKTAWLAVPAASPQAVADALDLRHRSSMDWTSGTAAAYGQGVFIAEPVAGWTLAHSPIHLRATFEGSDPDFPGWLCRLSTLLGEVQYFRTDRIGEQHGWARAVDGELIRAYFYGDGDVPLHVGALTDIERELGVGHRVLEEGWQSWGDQQWAAFFRDAPRERHVMGVAQRWSICPLDIPEQSVTEPGIHGFPPHSEPR
jgi:hypothetical protein